MKFRLKQKPEETNSNEWTVVGIGTRRFGIDDFLIGAAFGMVYVVCLLMYKL